MFDCTREGVLVSDTQGQIVHVNRAFIEITDGEIKISAGGSEVVINSGGVSVNGSEIKLNC